MIDRLTRTEINCTTGEETIIPLTDAEIAEIESQRIEAVARKAAEEVAAIEKAELKASAKTKLMAGLPLTAEEADVLVI